MEKSKMDGELFAPPPDGQAGIVEKLTLMAPFLPRQWIAAMLEVFGTDAFGKLSADDRRFLTGPICIHDGGWGDTLPKWMIEQAGAERVEIVLGKAPWIIGPTELAAVMYGAMMTAPRGADLTDLYLWATTQAAARHYGKPVAEYWQQLDHRPIADSDVLERSGRLWHDYQALAHEARRKTIAAQASRDREERHEVKGSIDKVSIKQPAQTKRAEPQQRSLF